MLSETQCWNALLARDRSFDGRFFFGVLTTGVYCRPSCPSRHPLRRNVRLRSAYKATAVIPVLCITIKYEKN